MGFKSTEIIIFATLFLNVLQKYWDKMIIFSIYIFWVTVTLIVTQVIYNFQVCHRPKITKKNLLSFKSGQIYRKCAQCAEINKKSQIKKSIFQLLDYEVFQNLTSWLKKIVILKDTLKRIFYFRVIFIFWDMVDFVFNIRSVLVWDLDEFRHFFMLGGLRPQVLLEPRCFLE